MGAVLEGPSPGLEEKMNEILRMAEELETALKEQQQAIEHLRKMLRGGDEK